MVMGRGVAGEEEDFDDNPFEDQVLLEIGLGFRL